MIGNTKTLAAAAALLTAAATGVLGLAAPAAQAAPKPVAAAHAAAVRVVRPGEQIPVGDGFWIELTADQVCQGNTDPTLGGTVCDSVTNGNQAPDSVGLRTEGLADGRTLYQALYLGDGAARMSVTLDGRTRPLHLLALPGHPGYAVGYAWGPAATTLGVTVRGADGTVLATF